MTYRNIILMIIIFCYITIFMSIAKEISCPCLKTGWKTFVGGASVRTVYIFDLHFDKVWKEETLINTAKSKSFHIYGYFFYYNSSQPRRWTTFRFTRFGKK